MFNYFYLICSLSFRRGKKVVRTLTFQCLVLLEHKHTDVSYGKSCTFMTMANFCFGATLHKLA